MSRIRSLIITSLLFGLMLLAIGTTTAAPIQQSAKNKPTNVPIPSAPPTGVSITWAPTYITASVAHGQTAIATATFTSSIPLVNVSAQISGDLGKMVQISPATITAVRAGVSTKLTLTISAPANQAHSIGGALQLRSGSRTLPPPLPIVVQIKSAKDN